MLEIDSSENPAPVLKERRGSVLIIGAGSGGLMAACRLACEQVAVILLEADSQFVGGNSRMHAERGFGIDLGDDRVPSPPKDTFELLGVAQAGESLVPSRPMHLFYRGRFLRIPLRLPTAFWQLGWIEGLRCFCSYVRAVFFPIRTPSNFRDWSTNRFGNQIHTRLFEVCVKKIQGLPGTAISADGMVSWQQNAHPEKALPRGAASQWSDFITEIRNQGGRVLLDQRVVECSQRDDGQWTVVGIDGEGNSHHYFAEHLISSAPLPSLAQMLRPALTPRARDAASALRSRASINVMLVCSGESSFADGWVYVPEPHVKVARIQKLEPLSNRAESASGSIAYGLEYFCTEEESLWMMSDEQLVALAAFELEWLGLVKRNSVRDGFVARQSVALPVHDRDYARHRRVIREELDLKFRNLHLIGRNGTHQPAPPDSSMVAGLRVAQAIVESVATTGSNHAQTRPQSCPA